MSLYDERMVAMVEYPLGRAIVPENGPDEAAMANLEEYYRRAVPFNPSPLYVLPMATETIVTWANGALTPEDVARVKEDGESVWRALKKKMNHVEMTTTRVFDTTLLWSLLVDRNKLALADDPSVPIHRIFAAGYELRLEGNNLAFWGEVPFTIRLSAVIDLVLGPE